MKLKDFLEQKAKFIQIALLGFAIICFFLFLSAVSSKQQVLRERDLLRDENTSLSGRIEQLENNLRENKNKIGTLTAELDKITQEKGELEKRFDLVKKRRDELADKLKNQPQPTPVVKQQVVEVQPQINDAYWAEILRSKTSLEMQLEALRSDLKNAQINNEQLQREKSTLGLDISNLSHEKEDLMRQLDYNQKLIDNISKELVVEKNDKIQIQRSLKALKSENAALVRQLKNLSSQKGNLDIRLRELQEQNSDLGKRFSEIEAMLEDRATQVGTLRDRLESAQGVITDRKESVVLAPIIVRPQGEPVGAQQQTFGTLSGKILAINRDNNFVIIDIGEEAGLQMGQTFQVLRDNNALGTIEVIQLRRDIAACDIKKENVPFSVGDEIK